MLFRLNVEPQARGYPLFDVHRILLTESHLVRPPQPPSRRTRERVPSTAVVGWPYERHERQNAPTTCRGVAGGDGGVSARPDYRRAGVLHGGSDRLRRPGRARGPRVRVPVASADRHPGRRGVCSARMAPPRLRRGGGVRPGRRRHRLHGVVADRRDAPPGAAGARILVVAHLPGQRLEPQRRPPAAGAERCLSHSG